MNNTKWHCVFCDSNEVARLCRFCFRAACPKHLFRVRRVRGMLKIRICCECMVSRQADYMEIEPRGCYG